MSIKYSRICILCIVMMLALLGMASAGKASGTSGNLTWTLSDDGVLTISGEGEMEDYDVYGAPCAPWTNYGDFITLIVIEDGVTSIGWYAFKRCSSLTGNKTATLTVAATAGRNNYRFRCVITDAEDAL